MAAGTLAIIDMTALRLSSMKIYVPVRICSCGPMTPMAKLTVAIRFATKAMMKKIKPSPKIKFTSLERSALLVGHPSLYAVRTRTVKSKHIE